MPVEMACCINLLTSTFRATAETTVSATADLRSAGRRPAVERAALLRASSDRPAYLGNRLCSSSVLPLASGASAETPWNQQLSNSSFQRDHSKRPKRTAQVGLRPGRLNPDHGGQIRISVLLPGEERPDMIVRHLRR